jgi:hypothetical protein
LGALSQLVFSYNMLLVGTDGAIQHVDMTMGTRANLGIMRHYH